MHRLLIAVAAFGCALLLAMHHPLWPHSALLATGLWSALIAWRPRIWLFAIPFALPFVHAAPWTGWVVWSEFDLLLLATLAGGYARRAASRRPQLAPPLPAPVQIGLAVLAAAALLGLLRAFADAKGAGGTFGWDWFASYTDPQNSLRVAKSEIFALLFVPLLPRAYLAQSHTQGAGAHQRLAAGMVAGLAVVVLAALWERMAFVGLLDFSAPYRTVALFWEMHVGGEAIDGYLALAAPFAAWAVLSARGHWQWLAAAALALLTGYAVLTTFSRGVYAGVLTGLVLLAVLLLRQRRVLQGWKLRAVAVLVLLLSAQAALVLGTGSFMRHRLQNTSTDLGGRLQHWQRGLATLQTPWDWLLGRGVGRLPTHYAAQGPGGEWSGTLGWGREPVPTLRSFATLRGPATRKSLGGQFAMVQRTPALEAGPHGAQLVLRVHQATDLQVQWCERHLLFDGHCQSAQLRVQPHAGLWQRHTLWLHEPQRTQGNWNAPRLALLSVSVLNAGGVADISSVQLFASSGRQLLHNSDFANGLARWQGSAQSYFLPWHIDNLALELLLERGMLGLLLFGALLGYALWQLTLGTARHLPLAPYQAAALTAALCVGLTGSLLDAPRVAFVLYLLAMDALLQAHGLREKSPFCVRKINGQKPSAHRLGLHQRMEFHRYGQDIPPLRAPADAVPNRL